MLVKNWMSKDVVTVNEDDSMQDALKLMKQHSIRMLPVLKNGSLVGVVTDRDLKRASASDATTLDVHELLYLVSKIKVKNIMAKNPISVPPDLTVEETAEVLLNNKISGA
ncbi:MAG TPA: CBS domain-containing protein, partial [Desulfobacterales bacterium]|nr:CBS domain-containing protein [Desulfobacterales bacterium]